MDHTLWKETSTQTVVLELLLKHPSLFMLITMTSWTDRTGKHYYCLFSGWILQCSFYSLLLVDRKCLKDVRVKRWDLILISQYIYFKFKISQHRKPYWVKGWFSSWLLFLGNNFSFTLRPCAALFTGSLSFHRLTSSYLENNISFSR